MKKYIYFPIIAIILLTSQAWAAISSVTLTAASPTTLSNGLSYYCAGQHTTGDYTFRIQAIDTAATGKAYWSNAAQHTINVAFPGGSSFYVDLNSPGADAFGGTNITVLSATDNSGGAGPYTAIDYTVVVRFNWNAAPQQSANNNITATVTANNNATSANNTRTFNFGIISQIAVLNFAQTGDAADGFVNPWHDAFNITGRIVYYILGQSITTQVPAAEINSLVLNRTGAPTAIANAGSTNDFVFQVGFEYFSNGLATAALVIAAGIPGPYTWSVTAAMNTPGGPELATGTLNVIVGMVSVNAGGLTFVNGGGVNNPPQPYYVRSENVSGTQLRLQTTAVMQGTVTFSVTDGTNTYNLQVLNGAATGTVLITPLPAVGPGGNSQVDYSVQSVTGGAYGNTNPANGQNVAARILNSGPYPCRWENAHWPGYGATPFTPQLGSLPPSSTATSFTLQWTPLSTGAPAYDADFQTYRIYFRRVGDPTWRMLDRSTDAALGLIGTGTYTVGGAANPLEPLTDYNYRISAIDVFGNEVPLDNQISGNVTTSAVTVEASITDGITSYPNSAFSNADPAAHTVRKTAIKVTVYIVTAGKVPERVNIIIAGNDSDEGPGTPQYGTVPAPAPNDDIISLASGTGRWTIPCVKITANTYQALIPSTHRLMRMNANIRFIVETVIGGVPTYYDHTPDAAPPGDWTQDEWRFRVSKKAVFFPWPTRVLNNVLTSAIPCCFPAYFLTVDSLVTIKVYDAKGRVINILADRMYRPGGQNIRDTGWCGVNKDNRRVGPGLYYIHIKAITLGNRTTLDKMLKVVVAH
ncbi:MAG TPA: fibronectin type III domain-containing protein [Spirochaetota bacterium]|nr:fibronectin type III domain-containing protein [Spirochaetota bacterium]HQF10410.1 fibronectin type III domain-containing protein [Spirochaetota bacterium]HQH99283.1 fibronectin type III domain-containing protein [Spirochaetota bacterium]